MHGLGLNSALGPVKNFVEEPHPVFGFVDPVLDQTRGGYIVAIVERIPDQRAMVCRNPGSRDYRRAAGISAYPPL
jgi:hypothetical protein